MSGVWRGRTGRARAAALLGAFAVAFVGCDIGTSVDDIPTTARVRVEGTAPDTLKLIVSANFFEQINLTTGDRYAVLEESDTLALSLPYDETWPLSELGSVYVELLYEPTSTASVTLRVNLDNGESFEQAATMSADAQLIYYWVWSGPLR
jgi:hypothetical protein